MPFTKQQIRRILDEDGQPIIDLPRSANLTLRVTESYLRRKLYAWEDRAVSQQWDVFDAALRDVRAFMQQRADDLRLTDLKRDLLTVRWQQAVHTYAAQRLALAVRRTAVDAVRYALTAWYAGYYGSAWQLDMLTAPDVRVAVPTPDHQQAHVDVLLPRMREAWEPDQQLFDLLGEDWRQQYGTELDKMLVRIRRALDQSVSRGENLTVAFRRVREAVGVQTDRRQGFGMNFHKIQTLTRTYMMSAANAGALALYQHNADIVPEVEWLAAKDERVCPICQRLDGTRWPLGDPALRTPPMDSHPNCRCTLIPVVGLSGNSAA